MRRLAIIIALLVFAATPALAQYPATGTILPAFEDEWFEVQTAFDMHGSFDDDARWINAELTDSGSLVLSMNMDNRGTAWPMVRLRELPATYWPTLNLNETPYLWYDFTSIGGEWSITLIMNAREHRLTHHIGALHGHANMWERADGPAGHFQGRMNIQEFLDGAEEVEVIGMIVHLVGGSSATLTIDALYFGSAEQTTPPQRIAGVVESLEEQGRPVPSPRRIHEAPDEIFINDPRRPVEHGLQPAEVPWLLLGLSFGGVIIAGGLAGWLLKKKS